MEYSNKFIPDKDENKKYEATFLNFLESLFPNQVYLSRYGENAENNLIDQEFTDALVIDAQSNICFVFQMYKNQKGDFNTCKNAQFTAKKRQITRNYNHINKSNASIIIKNGSNADEIEFKFNNIKVYYFIIYEGYEDKMISDFQKKINAPVDGGARMKHNFDTEKIVGELYKILHNKVSNNKDIDTFKENIKTSINFYQMQYYFDIQDLFIDEQKTTMIHVFDKESWEYEDKFSCIINGNIEYNKLNFFSVYFDNDLLKYENYLSSKESYFKKIINNKLSISIADERSLTAYYKLYNCFPKTQNDCLIKFKSLYDKYSYTVSVMNERSVQLYHTDVDLMMEVDGVVNSIVDLYDNKENIEKNYSKCEQYLYLKDVDVIKIQPAFDDYFMVLVWLKNKYPEEFDDTVLNNPT